MKRVVLCFLAVSMLSAVALAGGPMLVRGPKMGNPGDTVTWAQNTPINYRVDGGPLSRSGGTVVISNGAGITRVQSMFQAWQSVPTARLDIRNAGAILSVPSVAGSTSFTDGDVSDANEFDAVSRSCSQGSQSPVVFDGDGSLFSQLGLPSAVIGFAAPCLISNGTIVSGIAVLNGSFVDGINQPPNYELPADGFDAAFIHEFGHFLGLDHSQINVDCYFNGTCSSDSILGLPTMFPVLMTTEQKTLAADDIAWITQLYPGAGAANYGHLSGYIRFYDGVTQAQGVNVIARKVEVGNVPSLTTAVSVVSGFKFTGNPGQSVTGTNTGGSDFGSRDPLLIGYYEIPVPAGTYIVEVESVVTDFQGGSSVGPLDPPIPAPGSNEYYSSPENNTDGGSPAQSIVVDPGVTRHDIDIIMNGMFSRSDEGEDITLIISPDLGRDTEQSAGGAA
jgi:hypothetical protein